MADSRSSRSAPRAAGLSGSPREGPGEGPVEDTERTGGLEGLLQELIRRAATIGLGGFFLTEEAIRRAFSDVVPQDWVQFVARQSQATRGELIERMAVEFGSWLREMDPRTLASAVLENFSFSIRIEVSAQPKKEPAGEQRAPDRPRVE